MGRPKSKGQRTAKGRLSRSKLAMGERNPAPDYILERRDLFAFATPTKGPDGRHGELDQDICDGIGQLHILGLLDGHGLDAKDLRDAGRFFGEHYWTRYRETAPKTGKYERTDKSVSAYLGETAADRRFDRMDDALSGFDRQVLMSLVVDTAWGDEIIPWAQSLIDESLLSRKKFRKGVIRFPDEHDRAMLGALVRGLCVIVDGGMEMRRAA
jgi:hypothetical protein